MTDGRETNLGCPICDAMWLMKPASELECYEWDCLNCGLEVPNTVTIDGESIIMAMKKHYKANPKIFEDLFGTVLGMRIPEREVITKNVPEVETVSKTIEVQQLTHEAAQLAIRAQVPSLGTPHPKKPQLLLLRRQVTQPRTCKFSILGRSILASHVTLRYANCDVPPPPDRNPSLLINDWVRYETALEAESRINHG